MNGGGGKSWDMLTFDPDLNIVYIGTGIGALCNCKFRRSSDGDCLLLARR